MKKRGFEIVTKYQAAGLTLPVRSTAHSAGYDFACAEDFVLPSIWHYNFVRLFRMIRNGKPLVDDDFERASKTLKPFLVPTGIKAYMQADEYLMIANRSSNPLKKGLILPNGVGIIDADYYGNTANEGEIFIQMVNFSPRDVIIKKGERIGQGIFMPYLTADDEAVVTTKRTGGFGSSGR